MSVSRQVKVDQLALPVDLSVPNVHNMSDEEIGKIIKKKLKESSNTELELGYLASTIYHRATWTENHKRPNDGHFCDYLRETLGIGFTYSDNRRIMSMMDVYEGFARFQDAEVMKKLRLAGISKALMCLPYMDDDMTVDAVKKMLDVARNTSSKTLREKLQELTGYAPSSGPKARGNPELRVIAVLDERAPHDKLVAGVMFIPRAKPQDIVTERAWLEAFNAVRRESGLDVDALFAQVMSVWLKSLSPELLKKATTAMQKSMDKLAEALREAEAVAA